MKHKLHLMVRRCRVCAEILQDPDPSRERLCEKHNSSATTTEADLGRIAMRIQDHLQPIFEERRKDLEEKCFWAEESSLSKEEKEDNTRWEEERALLSSFNREQKYWYRRMRTFYLRCKQAWYLGWPMVRSEFLDCKCIIRRQSCKARF